MEGQNYLNQIAAESRPVKKQKGGILSSKFFLVGAIGLIALIVIIILGAILSGSKGSEKDLCFAFKLHLDNTAAAIDEYQSNVKSSALRSNSASLSSVISDTNHGLTEYITAKYDYKEKEVKKDILDKAKADAEELNTELFEAKINGILDRIYAHKMAYEISIMLSEENRIYNSTSDSALKDLIGTSHNSLEQLYDKFNSFSEAN